MVKNYTKTRDKCRVTFKLPAEVNAQKAAVCGEFNDWSKKDTQMKRLKDGSFSATLTLDAGHKYRFRYFLDNNRWENDWTADSYAPNEHGTEDSIVEV